MGRAEAHDNWAQTSRVTNRATGTTTRVTQTDQGGMVSRRSGGEGGNVYAGQDGNVYRRQDGQWQKNGEGGWSNVQPPEGTGERATQARASRRNRHRRSRSTVGPTAN